MRTEHTARWYPPGPWDWFYGPGYWWFAYDYAWYPGWRDWGCRRPAPWWYWRPTAPPEIVAEREVPIGADGTVKVEIDTSLAKELHPDQDHRYSIQAEVVDESRRTIVGTGDVLVARKPFEVFAWVDRGYYRVGDTIAASFAARRLDGKPVEGNGQAAAAEDHLRHDDGTQADRNRSRALGPGHRMPKAVAEIQIKASEKGQYRLSYRVTDKAGHEIEGGYLFTIIGEGFDGSEFRFNDLELVPDKREYAPGEKVQLQVNTNRAGSTVLLFVRPSNGVYLPPQVLRLDGKSTVVEVDVTQKDMPNFFVEAVTIADGQVHTEVREIDVPPAKRVLNVEVVPSAEEYQAGRAGQGQVKLTDADGKPFVGSTVLAIYDKSVEYISGGSNVADIKEFFWKWRRQHQPYLETNLDRWFANLVPPGQKAMESLGVFGDTVADDSETLGQAACNQRAEHAVAVASRARCGRVPTCDSPLRWPPPPKVRPSADSAGGVDKLMAAARRRRHPARARRTHRPQRIRRHRLLGRRARNQQGRHRRSRARHAGESHRLEDPRLGHGPRHARRRGVGRSRHPQEPHRPPAGAAVLRRERRSRALCQRPQLPADREASEGAAGARRQHARAADAPPRTRSKFPPAASSASIGA